MSVSRHSIIAEEGYRMIVVSAILVIVLHFVFGAMVTPLWLMVAAVAWLHRDPYREIPASPLGIVSPVDGRVMSTENIYDTYLGRESTRITLEISKLGVFSVRSVTEGKVIEQALQHAGNSTRVIIWVQTDESDDIMVRFTPGVLLSKLKSCLVPGERIGQGQRYGFLLFGAKAQVFLPTQARISVKPGDNVTAGADVLAELIR